MTNTQTSTFQGHLIHKFPFYVIVLEKLEVLSDASAFDGFMNLYSLLRDPFIYIL